jgi:hypothetical protein
MTTMSIAGAIFMGCFIDRGLKQVETHHVVWSKIDRRAAHLVLEIHEPMGERIARLDHTATERALEGKLMARQWEESSPIRREPFV